MIRWIIMICVFFAAACSDATCAKYASIGNRAQVSCYSGGKLIYQGESTGKVRSEENSDGYYFKDAKDGSLKEVSGNCVIVYLD
jgi:hypothetical protein